MKHARLHGAWIYNHRELMRLAKDGMSVAVVIREKDALCRVRVIPTQATLALSGERQHFFFNDGPAAGIEGQVTRRTVFTRQSDDVGEDDAVYRAAIVCGSYVPVTRENAAYLATVKIAFATVLNQSTAGIRRDRDAHLMAGDQVISEHRCG